MKYVMTYEVNMCEIQVSNGLKVIRSDERGGFGNDVKSKKIIEGFVC